MFGQVAGSDLNLATCDGLRIGCSKRRQRNCNPCNIKCPEKPVRCLGIYTGHNTQECNKWNFEEKLSKVSEY